MPDIKTASKREKNQARLAASEREQTRTMLKTIADKADIIINGYSFTREEDGIRVLNLNCPDKAAVFSEDCFRWAPPLPVVDLWSTSVTTR